MGCHERNTCSSSRMISVTSSKGISLLNGTTEQVALNSTGMFSAMPIELCPFLKKVVVMKNPKSLYADKMPLWPATCFYPCIDWSRTCEPELSFLTNNQTFLGIRPEKLMERSISSSTSSAKSIDKSTQLCNCAIENSILQLLMIVWNLLEYKAQTSIKDMPRVSYICIKKYFLLKTIILYLVTTINKRASVGGLWNKWSGWRLANTVFLFFPSSVGWRLEVIFDFYKNS